MDGHETIPGHDQQTSLLPIEIVGPQLPFTLLFASPLNSINILEVGIYQGVSAKAAEYRKHSENDPLSWAGDCQ